MDHRRSSDLRTLVPYDWEAIAESVKNKPPVHRRPRRPDLLRLRREIAARISNELFEYLDAPSAESAHRHLRGIAPAGRRFILPQSEDVEKAVQELMK